MRRGVQGGYGLMSGTIVARVLLDNASYQTAGELPRIGSSAPDVSLVNTKLQTVSLANWTGMRKVMYTGLSVDTETCAKSIIRFDEYAVGHGGIALLTVTCDLPFAHKRFGKAHDLQVAEGLSAIRHEGFGKNYGVLILDGPLAGLFSPAVVVMDENNTVVHREHIEDAKEEPNYGAAFRALGIEIND
jgi:thiol peroxidase